MKKIKFCTGFRGIFAIMTILVSIAILIFLYLFGKSAVNIALICIVGLASYYAIYDMRKRSD